MKHNNGRPRKPEASQQEWRRVPMGDEIGHVTCNKDRPGARPAGPLYTDWSIGRLEHRCCGDPKIRFQGSVVVTRNNAGRGKLRKEKKKEKKNKKERKEKKNK